MNTSISQTTMLFVTRYKSICIPFAFISMAIFHIPLFLNKRVRFYKLMGSGKNGTFDIHPDFNQWALMVFFEEKEVDKVDLNKLSSDILGNIILGWWKIFKVDVRVFLLEPYNGHGTWDGKNLLNPSIKIPEPIGKIAVLTRATIRLSKLKSFWSSVPMAAEGLEKNKGFLYSVGIGEVPFIKQATFSIWESVNDMKAFAYKKVAHQDIIKRTRKESWYSEEMFLRFRVIQENVHLNN